MEQYLVWRGLLWSHSAYVISLIIKSSASVCENLIATAITIAISLVLRFLSGCPDLEVECREWSCFLILCCIWRQNYEGRFHLFVGGRLWVYTSPLYTFQEELVLLLLHTTPYIYSLILLASGTRVAFRCGRREMDDNLHSLFSCFSFLRKNSWGVLRWIIVIGAFSFGPQLGTNHFRQ